MEQYTALLHLAEKYFQAFGKPNSGINVQPYGIGLSWNPIGSSTVYYPLNNAIQLSIPAAANINTVFYGYPRMHLLGTQAPSGAYRLKLGYVQLSAPFNGPSISVDRVPWFGFNDTTTPAPGIDEVLYEGSPQPMFMTGFYSQWFDGGAASVGMTVSVSFNGYIFSV